jgi:hypothetical protein
MRSGRENGSLEIVKGSHCSAVSGIEARHFGFETRSLSSKSRIRYVSICSNRVRRTIEMGEVGGMPAVMIPPTDDD